MRRTRAPSSSSTPTTRSAACRSRVAGLERAWIVGGGYKYLQLGEGNCFLRLPPQADELRPAITGWFAEFEELHAAHEPGAVAYPRGSMRFAGSTYDPTSHYRAARVLDFFDEQGLTPERLRAELPPPDDAARASASTRSRSTTSRATATRRSRPSAASSPSSSERAEELQPALLDAGVVTDSRGRYLRLGPAPYHSDEQLEAAIEELGRVAKQ